MLHRILLVVFLAVLVASPANTLAEEITSATPDIIKGLRESIPKLRAEADDLEKEATGWQRMADEARAKAGNPALSLSAKAEWLKEVAGYEQKTAQLRKFAAEKRNQADEKEARAKQLESKFDTQTPKSPLPPPTSPFAGSPASPTSPAPAPKSTTATPIGEQPKPAAGEGADCPPPGGPLALSEILRDWTDGETGAQVQISSGSGPSGTVTLKGRHSWQGTYDGGTLKVSRYPNPTEMGEAPEWAKLEVWAAKPLPRDSEGKPTIDIPLGEDPAQAQQSGSGKIKWELELESKKECGQPALEGKWYPGSYRWSEEKDPAGGAPRRTVSDVGRGTPIAVKYTLPRPSIVDVVVLQDQIAQYLPGRPSFAYPFQKDGGDDIRTLYVYGKNLPRSRDHDIIVASADPNVEYLVEAVRRDREINPALGGKFERGLELALMSKPAALHAQIRAMDAVILRARVKRGVLPGFKSFTLDNAAASWQLRFGDDVAYVTVARASDGSEDAPSALRADQVQPTEVVFEPERMFLEVRTQAPFPLEQIALKVGLGEKVVSWNGEPVIMARRIPGSETVYRTPAIELATPATATERVGAYVLPVTPGEVIFAMIRNPWLFRQSPMPAAAAILSGPGDLGHTYRYYLRRAAIADGYDTSSLTNPLPTEVLKAGSATGQSSPKGRVNPVTSNEWGILAGKVATRITNKSVITGVFKDAIKARTWKQALWEGLKATRRPLIYYVINYDQLLEHFDVTIADHAALLSYRDTFVEIMNREIDKLEKTKADYEKNKNSAKMRGQRDELKAFAWSNLSAWNRLQVTCPNGSACAFSYALSDSFLDETFKNDRAAADRWSVAATAEALGKMVEAAKEARDKAKKIADKEVKELLETLGHNYEPLLPHIVPRLMTQNWNGKWVPDLNAIYSLRSLHIVTDTLVAQEELAHADTMAMIKFAMVPLTAAAAPALVAAGVAEGAVAMGLWTADFFLTEIVPAYFELPSTKFALGASLALGAEHLTEVEETRKQIFHRTIDSFAMSTVATGAGGAFFEGIVPAAKATGYSAAKLARPYVQEIKLRGAAALKNLSREEQAGVLNVMARAKAVEAEGVLQMAGAFEREAVEAANRLAKETGVTLPKPVEEPVVAARGNPEAAHVEPPKMPTLGDVDGKLVLHSKEVMDQVVKAKTGTEGPKGGGGAAPVEMAIEQTAGGERSVSLPIRTEASAPLERFNIGDGKPIGSGVWNYVYELKARNGKAVDSPTAIKVLKMGPEAGDGHFTAKETVLNSKRAYDEYVRNGVPVLKTEFFPEGLTRAGDQPFMLQELIEGRAAVLDDLVKNNKMPTPVQRKFVMRTLAEYQQLPEKALHRFFALVKQVNDKLGIVIEDVHDGNFFIELREGATWKDFFDGNAEFRIGPLEYDRSFNWAEYADGKAGRMGEWLTMIELRVGPDKVRSLKRFYENPQNKKLLEEAAELYGKIMNKARQTGEVPPPDDPTVVAYNDFFRKNPGPHWPRGANYYQGKMLEGKHWVNAVFTENGAVMIDGQIGKTTVPLKIAKQYFPDIDDAPTRFGPFTAGSGDAPAQASSSNPLRRRRNVIHLPARCVRANAAARPRRLVGAMRLAA